MEENAWKEYSALLEDAYKRKEKHASRIKSLFGKGVSPVEIEQLLQLKIQINAYHAARCKSQKAGYLEDYLKERIGAVEELEHLFDRTAESGMERLSRQFSSRYSSFLDLRDVNDIPVIERKRQELSQLCDLYASLKAVVLFKGGSMARETFDAYLSSLDEAAETNKGLEYILKFYLDTEWNDCNIGALKKHVHGRFRDFFSGRKNETLDSLIEKFGRLGYFEGAVQAKNLKEEILHFTEIYNEAVLARHELRDAAEKIKGYLPEIEILSGEGISSEGVARLAEMKAETAKGRSEWAGILYLEKELSEYSALAETLKQKIKHAEILMEKTKAKNVSKQATAKPEGTMPAYFPETGSFSLPVYLASIGRPENDELFFLREALLRYDEKGWTGALEKFSKKVQGIGLARTVQDLAYVKSLATGLKEFMARGYLAQRVNNFESTRMAAVYALDALGSYISKSENVLCAN